MVMTINTNVVSINAQRNLSLSGGSLSTTMQRLSSGLRVNSAKDDAAGLAIAERMNAQSKGLAVAARNANDGISLAQTAEGALGKVGDMLQRMRELAVQSSNATNSTADREALQAEVNQLRSEIDRVAKTTTFNGQKILDGSFTGGVFQIGAGAGDNITVGGITNAKAEALSTATFGKSTSEAVKASDVTGFSSKIDAGALKIRVGANPAVELGEIAAANSGQERMGQVVAAINAKTADTGVTAFLEEKDGAFTLQLRSASGDAVGLEGFNKAQTGFGADVTVGLKNDQLKKAQYTVAADKLKALMGGDAAAFEALVTAGTPNAFNAHTELDAVGTALNGNDGGTAFAAAYSAFKTEVLGSLDANAKVPEDKVAGLQKAATELMAALDTAALANGADNRAAVYQALDDVLKLDATDLATAWGNGTPASGGAIKTLNDALKAANGDVAIDIKGLSITANSSAEELAAARNSILSQVDEFMSGKLGVQTSEAKSNVGITNLDISTQAGAWEALASIDSAIDQVNAARADLGALQTRFEKAIENIDIQNENISAARGRIVDADFATETANLSRAQILQQAGTAMVAQANQLPQGVLSLLQ